jgi:hypothetical protein
VSPVRTDAFAPFAARGAGFVGGKLMSRPLFVGGLSALASDFALSIAIH